MTTTAMRRSPMNRRWPSLSVSGGSRHADPPCLRPRCSGLTPVWILGGCAVSRLDALNPIQLAAGNVGTGAGQLFR
jgi:hypothetical protein